jgi:hypothetical protein
VDSHAISLALFKSTHPTHHELEGALPHHYPPAISRSGPSFQIASAAFTASFSFAIWSASVTGLHATVEAKPH